MMRRGPIQIHTQERLDDRSGRVLALWEKSVAPGTPAALPWRTQDSLAPSEWQSVLGTARSVVVACTARHPKWMEEVIRWATQTPRLRTYLFGPEPWVSSGDLQTLLKGAASRLLARLGPEPPADWIVADQERGWLLLGAPGAERRWLLPLSPALARSLHEAFVHLFWHQARSESGPGHRFGPCLPAPFPKPAAASQQLHQGRMEEHGAPVEPLLPDAELAVEPEGLRPCGAARLVLTPPGRDAFARLVEQTGQRSELAWFEAGLPRLALTRRRMVLELAEGPNRLHLDFDAQAAIQVMNVLEQRARNGAWRFYPARALRDVQGPVWLEGATAEQQVHDQLDINLGRIPAPELLTLQNVTPREWKEPTALGRRIRYQWQVVPPSPPPGARPAELLRKWEQLDTHVEKRATTALSILEAMEQEERDRGVLSRLVGLLPLWGDVNIRRKRLRRTLDEIREQPLSKRPTDAPKLMSMLEAQENELVELDRFCREQEEQEALRVAEEQQRAHHEKQQQEAQRNHERLTTEREHLRGQLAGKRGEMASLETEVSARAEQLARAAYEARLNKTREQLAEVREKLPRQEQLLAEAKEALEGLPKDAPKDEKKSKKAGLHKEEETLKRLQADEKKLQKETEAPFRQEAERVEPDAALNELKARRQTLRQELATLEQKEGQLQTQLEACVKQLDTPFRFQPPPPSKPGRKQGTAPRPVPVPIPDEHLPALGQLLEHSGKRYLQVSTWEQATLAKADADRLGALLVAVESTL